MPNNPKHRYCIEGFACLGWPDTRIYELINTAAEDGIDLNLDSLESFKEFINTKLNLTRPMLTLTTQGMISATWGDPKDRHFNIRFNPDRKSLYLYVPLSSYVGKTIDMHLEQVSDEVMNITLDMANILGISVYDPEQLKTGDTRNA